MKLYVFEPFGPQPLDGGGVSPYGEGMATFDDQPILDGFPCGLAERLGGYVYLLIDPREGAIFYVGKGGGERVFQHGRDARSELGASAKLDRIRSIRAAHLEPRLEIVRHHLDEQAAYHCEAALIDALRLRGEPLTNLVGGHHRDECGHRSIAQLVADYAARPVVVYEADKAVLVKLNGSWTPGMTADELYKHARGWWGMNGWRRDYVRLVLVAYAGVIRAAYRVEQAGWKHDDGQGRDRRWQWTGARSVELNARFVNHYVVGLRPFQAQFTYLFREPVAA